MRKALTLFLLLACCLFCTPAFSAPDLSAVTVKSADCSAWPNITLKANLPAPSQQNLSLSLPGLEAPLSPTEVMVFRDSRDVRNLLVAIDTSKSLSDDFLTAIKAALRDHLHHLGQSEQIAILAFNDDVKLHTAFTESQERVESDLETLKQGGSKTVLYQALLKGADLLRPLSGEKTMLVISDGHNEGVGELGDVLQAAKAAQVRVLAVALPEKHKDRRLHREQLQTLAEETGGVFQAVESPLSAASGIFTILKAERQNCQVRFTAPADYVATETPLKAVFSVKSGAGTLSIDVALDAPLAKTEPEPEKTLPEQALDFVKTPAGMGCAAAAILVLLLLAYLLSRFFRKKKSRPEQDSLIIPASQGPKPSPFVLEIVKEGRSFPLPCGKTRLGAAKENDIVLSDPTVSRKHALIEIVGNECRVTDTQSTNGIFINGQRINRTCILRAGDELYFGKTQAFLRTVQGV